MENRILMIKSIMVKSDSDSTSLYSLNVNEYRVRETRDEAKAGGGPQRSVCHLARTEVRGQREPTAKGERIDKYKIDMQR